MILDNTFEVTLNRGSTGLGLSLSGGLVENKPVEIVDIYPNQPADLSGQLNVGDIILSINNIPMHTRNVQVCLYYSYQDEENSFSRIYHLLLVMQLKQLNLLFVDLIVENMNLIWSNLFIYFIKIVKILVFV